MTESDIMEIFSRGEGVDPKDPSVTVAKLRRSIHNAQGSWGYRHQSWWLKRIKDILILLDAGGDNVDFKAQASMILKKNKDYGNAPLKVFGPYGILVRINDKVCRWENLSSTSKTPNFESLGDTKIDALNYCALAVLLIEDKLS